jgi:hypothetical protein
MLRRMNGAMPLADADGGAHANLDILGGGWNSTGPRACQGQACAELEARLTPPPVTWEGIAGKRWGGA